MQKAIDIIEKRIRLIDEGMEILRPVINSPALISWKWQRHALVEVLKEIKDADSDPLK